MKEKSYEYMYGKIPDSPQDSKKILIYHNIEKSGGGTVGDIYGVFRCKRSLVGEGDSLNFRFIIGEGAMGFFERKYQGRFEPFKKD